LIGMTEKAKELTLVGDEIRQAFNDRFYDSETKVYSTGSQTAMAMPLYLGLVHEDDREAVLANIIISVTSPDRVTESGIPVRQSEHIEIAGSFDGKLGLVIGSGDYRFRFEN